MTSPVALYLAAYLAECGEPGWTPDPTGRHVVIRDGERIEAICKMGGWVYECPRRFRAPPFSFGLSHPIARGPGPTAHRHTKETP